MTPSELKRLANMQGHSIRVLTKENYTNLTPYVLYVARLEKNYNGEMYNEYMALFKIDEENVLQAHTFVPFSRADPQEVWGVVLTNLLKSIYKKDPNFHERINGERKADNLSS